jgi:small-conductance mechanosensitive channel
MLLKHVNIVMKIRYSPADILESCCKMNLIYILNLLVTIALIAPITIILSSRLLKKKTFIFLAFYYFITFAFNLMLLEFIRATPVVIKNSAIINNLLDGPLMLGFMLVLVPKNREKRVLIGLILCLLIYNATVLAVTGFTITTIQICLGPSLAICFIFGLRYFLYYTKTNLRRPGTNVNGKALISGALVAMYAAYIFVFLFYYLLRTNPIIDAYIIYCSITIFSVGFMSIGLYREILRLRKIDEVQTARKELADLYDQEKDNPNRKRTRSLDDLFGFDPSEMVPGFRN